MNELRKKIWIDPFQTGLVVRISLFLLLCQVTVWAFNVLCDQIQQYGAALGADLSVFSNIYLRALLALLVILVPVLYETIKFAHRLVGPLYRFRVVLRDLADGKPVSMIHLRQGDFLMDLRDDFNAMLEQMEKKGAVVIKRSPAGIRAAETATATPTVSAIVPAAPAHS